MIKAVIVDDEQTAIKSLKWEIQNFCSNVEVVDCFTDPVDAISAINYIKPDCVFLDIEMPEMDGFQLLNELKYRSFDLIITTAFDSYALKAFKESAIDYLLKPVDSDDLMNAVAKVKVNKKGNLLGKELEVVLANLAMPKENQKIAIPLAGKTIFVHANDINYCKSDGNYTMIFFNDASKKMISKKLKDTELIINNTSFFRVHNSYLVNTNKIKELVKNEGTYLLLEDGSNIPVSRSRKSALLDLLNS